MITAVIFDIDGTLLDSVDLHAEAWREALERFGKKISFAEVRRQIGKGGDQLMPVFLSREELQKFGAELERYRSDLFKKEFLPRVTAFPDVRQLFQRIRQDDKRIALASSAKGDELKTYKAIAGIDDLIEAETSSDDAERSKPYPDIFQAALAELGDVTPDQVLVVGDTAYDAEAAAQSTLADSWRHVWGLERRRLAPCWMHRSLSRSLRLTHPLRSVADSPINKRRPKQNRR